MNKQIPLFQQMRKKYGFKAPWIGVDLDGVLAEANDWIGYDHIGNPIEPVVKVVERLIAEEKTVKIFTARCEGGVDAYMAIKKWLKKHGLPNIGITNVKDSGCTAIVDDLAVFSPINSGKFANPIENWKYKIVFGEEE